MKITKSNFEAMPWHVVVTEENKEVLSKWIHTELFPEQFVGMWLDLSNASLNKGFSGSHHDHRYTFGEEISFEQFKSIVLDEFVLPENWGIKRTLSTDKIITDYIHFCYKVDHSYYKDNMGCPWLHNKTRTSSNRSLHVGSEEISFDQFLKYVLKVNDINELPVSYELIKLYPGSKELGYKEINIFDESVTKFPEFWSPIYDVKLKLYDWVTITGDRYGWLLHTRESTFQVVGEPSKYDRGTFWTIKSRKSRLSGALDASYRKATYEEIISSRTPSIVINGYAAEFYPDHIVFGCAKIDKNIFIALDDPTNFLNGNREVHNITIGQGKFAEGHIKLIAEYYKNLNT